MWKNIWILKQTLEIVQNNSKTTHNKTGHTWGVAKNKKSKDEGVNDWRDYGDRRKVKNNENKLRNLKRY